VKRKEAWGAGPEAISQPAGVRAFYLANPVPTTPEGLQAWTPPAVGNFALAVTGGYGPDAEGRKGVGTWGCTFRPPEKPATPPVPYETLLGEKLAGCQATLDVLGCHLHGSVVKGGKTPFSAGSGGGQVDYKRVCRAALSETGLIVGFLRAVCSGSDALLTEEEFRRRPAARKKALSAWAASQLIVGRQYSHGSRVVGTLQMFIAGGQNFMDSTPFGAALRSFGAAPLSHLLSSSETSNPRPSILNPQSNTLGPVPLYPQS